MSRPAWFFDRDGVVNRSPGPGYLLSWDGWEWMPGIFDLLHAVREQGCATVLVTSQRGVGKGLMSEADLQDIHARMQDELQSQGIAFDAIYAFTGLASCPNQAKPDPQMILAAAEDLHLDLRRSWLIGDADRDIEMGKRANLFRTIRVRGDKPIGIEADVTVDTLHQAQEHLARL